MKLMKSGSCSFLVKLLLALVMLCSFAAIRVGAMAADVQSAGEFTTFVARTLESAEHVGSASISRELGIRLVVNGQERPTEIELNLSNIYLEYRSNPTGRDKIVGNYIESTIASIVNAFKPTAKNIVAIVRNEVCLRDFGKGNGTELEHFVYEPLAGNVIVVYAIDMPTATTPLLADRLEEFGVKRSDVPEIARANLDSIYRSADFQPQLGGNDHIRVLVGGGAYLTSLLLMDQYWTRERFPFKGDLVVYVLARETMLVTGSDESIGIEFAAKIVEKDWGLLPYQISQQPLVRRNGIWQSFQD